MLVSTRCVPSTSVSSDACTPVLAADLLIASRMLARLLPPSPTSMLKEESPTEMVSVPVPTVVLADPNASEPSCAALASCSHLHVVGARRCRRASLGGECRFVAHRYFAGGETAGADQRVQAGLEGRHAAHQLSPSPRTARSACSFFVSMRVCPAERSAATSLDTSESMSSPEPMPVEVIVDMIQSMSGCHVEKCARPLI